MPILVLGDPHSSASQGCGQRRAFAAKFIDRGSYPPRWRWRLPNRSGLPGWPHASHKLNLFVIFTDLLLIGLDFIDWIGSDRIQAIHYLSWHLFCFQRHCSRIFLHCFLLCRELHSTALAGSPKIAFFRAWTSWASALSLEYLIL